MLSLVLLAVPQASPWQRTADVSEGVRISTVAELETAPLLRTLRS